MRTRATYMDQPLTFPVTYRKSASLDKYDSTHNGASYPVWPAEVVVNLSNTSGSHYQNSLEFIDDDSSNRYQPWVEHNCQHYKRLVSLATTKVGIDMTECFNLSFTNDLIYRGIWTWNILPMPTEFGTLENPTIGIPQLFVGSSSVDYSLTTEYNPDNLIRAAWASLIPTAAPKLLLLSELYQLKDIVPSVRRTIRRVQLLEREYNLALKVAGSVGPLKRVLRLGRKLLALPADIFLQWKFNVEPTLGDIAAIQAALSTVRSQVKVYLEAGRQRKTAYYSCPLDSYYSNSFKSYSFGVNTKKIQFGINSTPWSPLQNTSLYYDRIYRDCNYSLAVFHAKVEYSYEYPIAWQKFAELDTLTDLLGVGTNPLSDIWEIIPWSFVVDWLFHVNKWLEQFDNVTGKPVTIIHKWCWSHHIKRSIQTRYRLHRNAGTYYPAWNYQTDAPVGTVYEDAYLRSTHGTSGYSSLLASHGLTEDQFVLASALGLTR